MKTDRETLLATQQARVDGFMRNELNASTKAWAIPGPENTIVDEIQCWVTGTPTGALRLVMVELLSDGGFEVFPQVMPLRLDATAQVVRELDTLEARS